MIKRRALILLFCSSISLPRQAHAGASILGFSVGDDTMTLSAILGNIIQQVKILNDVATMTRVMRDNISFMKDVIETGNDIVSGRWDEVSDQFLGTLLASDDNLREIIRNSEMIMTNRVPRNSMFRRLLVSGFEHVLSEAFGPYPFGEFSTGLGLVDTSAMSLNEMAREQMRDWKAEHRRLQQAIRECQKYKSFEVCNSAANRMQIQATQQLEQIKAIEAQRAKAEATKMAAENGEKKERILAAQKDITDVVEAVEMLSKTSTTMEAKR